MRVLVVNAGSSSLKVDLVGDGERTQSYDGLPATAPDVDAVGHRIVHGGPDLVEPVVIDAAVEKQLRDLVQPAPLHQPKSLDGLAAIERRDDLVRERDTARAETQGRPSGGV
jgi:acetate kinase